MDPQIFAEMGFLPGASLETFEAVRRAGLEQARGHQREKPVEKPSQDKCNK